MSGNVYNFWVGFEPRQHAAFQVARDSIRANLISPSQIYGVVLTELQRAGLYTRPTEESLGKLYDVRSTTPDYNGEMSTAFAISRFFVPMLSNLKSKRDPEKDFRGWAMFIDCDVMVRAPLDRLFEKLEPKYALYCVKHKYEPSAGQKMDGCSQSIYSRKNWSSVMIYNCDHPANDALTMDVLNHWPGRDLHAMKWLEDDQIGELDPAWNWLVGEQTDRKSVV